MPTNPEQGAAARLTSARQMIQDVGAAALPRPPWLAGRQPHSDAELIRYVLWRTGEAAEDEIDTDAVLAALQLMPSARAELDQLEAGLLFAARSRGLTWPQIAHALGLASAQAAQQRTERIAARLGAR